MMSCADFMLISRLSATAGGGRPGLARRQILAARDDFGERRLLIGGAHHADQPCRCGADAHDVEFDQLGLLPGRMAGQRDTPISSL